MRSAGWRSIFALIPLCIWMGVAHFLLFYVHSGHHRAASPTVSERESTPTCGDDTFTPLAARTRWGEVHGDPLIILHISDLHISDVDNGAAKQYTLKFVRDVLPRFEGVADVFAITGDLVSSKRYAKWPLKGLIGYSSTQIAEEWEWFNRTVRQSYVLSKRNMLFVAVPGNHDVFGSRRFFDKFVLSSDSPPSTNERLRRVRTEQLRGHSIVALDATLFPSPHRPLNFFGGIGDQMAEGLERAFVGNLSNPESGAIISLCHYPSSVLSSGSAIDTAFASAMRTRDSRHPSSPPRTNLYLSGHLHSLRGALPRGMQAVEKEGRIELQLPDMASTGSFRVLAVDHGVPSWGTFAVPFNANLPIVVVMNPPRAGLCPPGAGFAALRSSHVRLFVLPGAGKDAADEHLRSLAVYIDDSFVGHPVPVPSPPRLSDTASKVFIVPWNSDMYWHDGLVHNMDIFVGVGPSRRLLLRHPFSLKGKLPSGVTARLRAFLGAFLTLSNFELIARHGVRFGIFTALGLASFMFVACPQLRFQAALFALFILCLLFDLPLLVARRLSDAGGFGFASLSKIYAFEGTLHNPVDPLFVMFFVVNSALVPAIYISCAESYAPSFCRSWIFDSFRLVVSLRSLTWTLNVVGAHGLESALLSPSCILQTVLVVWCCWSQRRESRCRFKDKGA